MCREEVGRPERTVSIVAWGQIGYGAFDRVIARPPREVIEAPALLAFSIAPSAVSLAQTSRPPYWVVKSDGSLSFTYATEMVTRSSVCSIAMPILCTTSLMRSSMEAPCAASTTRPGVGDPRGVNSTQAREVERR